MKCAVSLLFGFLLAGLPAQTRPEGGVYLESLALEAALDGPTAETRLRALFVNAWEKDAEVRWLLPLPPWSAVLAAELDRDGRRLPVEPQPAERARETYRAIRDRLMDPLLIEYAGTDSIAISACPIAGRGRVEVQIELASLMPLAGSWRAYRFPFGAFGDARQGPFRVAARVVLPWGLRPDTVHCAAPGARLCRGADGKRAVCWEAQGGGAQDLQVALLAGGESRILANGSGGPRTFLAELPVPCQAGPRRAVFLVEVSGNLDRVRQGLARLLAAFGPADAFNLIFYDDTVRQVFEAPVPARPRAVKRALSRAAALLPRGTPALGPALALAAEQARALPGCSVVLVAPSGSQLSVPPGVLRLVPEEAAGPEVDRLLETLASLAVADARVLVPGVRLADLVFPGIESLRCGGALPVLGRFEGQEPSRALLWGRSAGRRLPWLFPLELERAAQGPAWLPALWAHLGLLALLPRLQSEDPAALEAAKRFIGIGRTVNPWVALLAVEKELDRGRLAGSGVGLAHSSSGGSFPFTGPTATIGLVAGNWTSVSGGILVTPGAPGPLGDAPSAPWEPCKGGSPASRELVPATPGAGTVVRK